MRIARWLALGALVVGCGDDDPGPSSGLMDAGDAAIAIDASKDATPGIDASKDASAPVCDFAGELARRVGANPIDCGDVPPRAELSALMTAQKCVLDAVAAKRAFRLKVQWMGTDSYLVDAFASDGTHASILHDDNDSRANRERLDAQLCESLELDPQCGLESRAGLCLRCKGTLESSEECAPQLPSGECHPVGNYEAGKEGSYRPCCPGLREVFQQRQGEDGAGNKMCFDPPLRISSCIQGRCGDGRCEEQERNPCGGCSLDCK